MQAHPSAAVFPEREGLAGVQARAVAAIRRHDVGSRSARAAGGVARLQPRRRHQGGTRRRARHPPRRLPADHGRHLLDQRRALHRDPPVRRAGERPRRRRGGPPFRPSPQRRRRPAARSSDARRGRRHGTPEAAVCRGRRGGGLLWDVRHVTCHPCLPPARALRRRDRRRARRPLVLPAGDRGRHHHQRAAGEAAGLGARRAHRRVAHRGRPPLRRGCAGDPAAPISIRSPCRSRRSSASARWGWAGMPTPSPSWSSCSPSPRRRSTSRSVLDDTEEGPTPCGCSCRPARPRVRRPRRAGRVRRSCALPAVRRAARPAGARLRPPQRVPPEVPGRGAWPVWTLATRRCRTCSARGRIDITGRLVDASDATLFGTMSADGVQAQCVYKPVRGERPLWDFPDGTLAGREVASFLVSEAAGFHVVPPTVYARRAVRPRIVQIWVDTDERELVDVARRRRCRPAGSAYCAPAATAASPPCSSTPTRRAAPDGRVRRRRQQRRPQGWPRAGRHRRQPVRRRPRPHAARRGQASHGAVGLGRAGAACRRRRGLEKLRAELDGGLCDIIGEHIVRRELHALRPGSTRCSPPAAIPSRPGTVRRSPGLPSDGPAYGPGPQAKPRAASAGRAANGTTPSAEGQGPREPSGAGRGRTSSRLCGSPGS